MNPNVTSVVEIRPTPFTKRVILWDNTVIFDPGSLTSLGARVRTGVEREIVVKLPVEETGGHTPRKYDLLPSLVGQVGQKNLSLYFGSCH